MTIPASPSTSDPSSPSRPPILETPELFTLPRAALQLSVSKRTLERLIASGEFPSPIKIGRSSRVLRTDIATYLDQLCRERGDQRGAS
jgi:excisionase family DNA binding protein